MMSAFDQIISSGGHSLTGHRGLLVDGVREPLVIDFRDTLAGAVNDVDELVAVMRLASQC
jgi:hypothetical protein